VVPPRQFLDPQPRVGQVFAHVSLHHVEQYVLGACPGGTERVTSRSAIASTEKATAGTPQVRCRCGSIYRTGKVFVYSGRLWLTIPAAATSKYRRSWSWCASSSPAS
jgi:hypothetical protein